MINEPSTLRESERIEDPFLVTIGDLVEVYSRIDTGVVSRDSQKLNIKLIRKNIKWYTMLFISLNQRNIDILIKSNQDKKIRNKLESLKRGEWKDPRGEERAYRLARWTMALDKQTALIGDLEPVMNWPQMLFERVRSISMSKLLDKKKYVTLFKELKELREDRLNVEDGPEEETVVAVLAMLNVAVSRGAVNFNGMNELTELTLLDYEDDKNLEKLENMVNEVDGRYGLNIGVINLPPKRTNLVKQESFYEPKYTGESLSILRRPSSTSRLVTKKEENNLRLLESNKRIENDYIEGVQQRVIGRIRGTLIPDKSNDGMVTFKEDKEATEKDKETLKFLTKYSKRTDITTEMTILILEWVNALNAKLSLINIMKGKEWPNTWKIRLLIDSDTSQENVRLTLLISDMIMDHLFGRKTFFTPENMDSFFQILNERSDNAQKMTKLYHLFSSVPKRKSFRLTRTKSGSKEDPHSMEQLVKGLQTFYSLIVPNNFGDLISGRSKPPVPPANDLSHPSAFTRVGVAPSQLLDDKEPQGLGYSLSETLPSSDFDPGI